MTSMKYEQLYRDLVLLLTRLLDAGMPYHSWRVALITDLLGGDEIQQVRSRSFFAALLHDLGALGLEDGISEYPGAVSAWQHFINWGVQSQDDGIFFNHPVKGAEIFRTVPLMEEGAELIEKHHERFDGNGFPGRLAGEDIPSVAQHMRIADSFDLLLRTTALPSFANVLGHLRRDGGEVGKGVTEAFVSLAEEWFHRFCDEPALVKAFYEVFDKRAKGFFEGAKEAHVEALIRVFSSTLDTRHPYLAGHSTRVALYARELAKAVGLKPSEIKAVSWAGHLHDIGRVFIPRRVMSKPERLDDREMRLVRQHPVAAMRLLGQVSGLGEIAEIAGHHHERWDGTGYPDALKGEEIPLGSRILSLCDLFDAVTSDRAYRKAMPRDLAFKIIRKNTGTQLDPGLVEAAHDALLTVSS
jgi:HD-GYP domain-containing protein (c-di-GMP phosphodiesterase class II)